MMIYDRIWIWRTRMPERKGMRCRIVAASRMQSALVEFEDGYRVVTSVRGLRKNEHVGPDHRGVVRNCIQEVHFCW